MNFRLKSYSEYPDTVQFVLEMHSSMWIEELREYSIKDLFSTGTLYNNPEQLNTTPEIIEKFRRGFYNVYPMKPSYYFNSSVSGFIYVTDNEDGKMYPYHVVESGEPTEDHSNSFRHTL